MTIPLLTLAPVVVDIPDDGSLLRSLRLLRQINSCTAPDGIRVTARRTADDGHALAALQSPRRERD